MKTKLIETRRAAKLTKSQAAKALRITAEYLDSLESGALELPLRMAARMAIVYGCTISDLVGGVVSGSKTTIETD